MSMRLHPALAVASLLALAALSGGASFGIAHFPMPVAASAEGSGDITASIGKARKPDTEKSLKAGTGLPLPRRSVTKLILRIVWPDRRNGGNVIDVGNADSVELRQSIELFAHFMNRIGVVIRPNYNNWPTFLGKLEHRQVQLYYLAWTADYPDAQNFLLLFYGKGVSPGPNHSNYINPEFDSLYEVALTLPDSPDRTELYRRMGRIAREDCPWILHADRMKFVLRQGWAKNFKFHPLAMGLEKYIRIERGTGPARPERGGGS